jgi:membrane protease YdiL (CAAX protease family)
MDAPPSRTPILRSMHPAGFAFVALALVFVLYQVVAGGITLLLAHGTVTEDNVPIVRWATLIGQALFILVPAILLARWRGERPMAFFRFTLPAPGEVAVTVVAMFALQQVLQGYLALQDAIPLPPQLERIVDLFKRLLEETYRLLVMARSPWEFLFVVITVALMPAFAEEFLFRGLIQRTLEGTTGGLRAAVITGIVFGAYHLNPFTFVPLAALGIYFGFIVYRSNTISLAIAAHFFNNAIAATAAYMNLKDDFVAIDPFAAATTAMIAANAAFFAFVFVLATAWFMRMTASRLPQESR